MFKLLKGKKNLVKYSDRKRLLIISNKAMSKITKLSCKITDVESGGILLGKIYHSYDVISDIIMPCKKDKKGLSYFIRSFNRANKVIKKEWKRSKGKINYLGEWHTHKDIEPTPSVIDKEMIKDVFLDVGLEIDQIYLFIIGIENSIWIGKQKNKNLYKLEKIN
jgi:integrative and conjugative element protein (TIGR02256 family)